MSGPRLDEIAEDLLAAEEFYEPGEWAAIEDYAVELLGEARSAGADPREYAAARLVNLVVKLNDKERLDGKAEDLRVELATAAALVYVGRIGYV